MAGHSRPREPFLRTVIAHGRDRPAIRRCLLTAVVVGTLLGAINQGDLLLRGGFSAAIAVKLCLNYVVPFAVSSFGFISARRMSSGSAGAGGRAAS